MTVALKLAKQANDKRTFQKHAKEAWKWVHPTAAPVQVSDQEQLSESDADADADADADDASRVASDDNLDAMLE